MGLWKNPDSWRISEELPKANAKLPTATDVSAQALERSLELTQARQAVLARAEMFGLADKFALLMEGFIGPAAAKEPDIKWSEGFSAAIPLPIFNQGQPAVFRARAELKRSMEEYVAISVNVMADARSLSRQAAVADSRARHFESSLLPLRRQVVQETKLQYNAMQLGPFELLEAKNEEISAQQSYVDTLEQYWLVRTKLEALMSGRMISDELSS
jgi:cobalt-zinc-cadmium efflux system outer membrane protein